MLHGAFARWMYRGHRPNWLAKAMNNSSTWLVNTPLAAHYGMVELEVIGRVSGRTITLPLVLFTLNGERYLVSMLGDDVQWVKNVRAAGMRATLVSRDREAIRLEDVPVEQRAPIIKEYLRHAPGARPHIPVERNAPLAEFERIAALYPVFRVLAVEAA